MTQFSMLPWTTGGAGDGATPYTQEQSNNFFRFFDVRNPATEGIVLGVLNELAVSGSSSPLSVASGAAVCYGRYWNDSAASLAVSTPGVGTTGGRVVLRCTWATRQIRLAVKMSANGIATPPNLTQTFGTTWEISLATFTITTGGAITLTDDRSFRKATFQVDEAALADDAVPERAIQNSAVTEPKIDDLAVTTPKLNDYAVVAAKTGIATAHFSKRVGTDGSADWRNDFASNNIPITQRLLMQFGVKAVTIPDGQEFIAFSVTFPDAYLTTPPLVFCQPIRTSAGTADDLHVVVNNTGTTSSQFSATVYARAGLTSGAKVLKMQWIAIGPSTVQPA